MNDQTRTNIRRTAAYFLILTVILYIITGYGITQYQAIEKLTFGMLNKALSFKVHMWLIYPFVIFLFLHLYFSCDLLKWLRKNGKNK